MVVINSYHDLGVWNAYHSALGPTEQGFECRNICDGRATFYSPPWCSARGLVDIWSGLGARLTDVEERLDALYAAKCVAKDWDCTPAHELVGLIDREAELLNRCALNTGVSS